MVSVRTSSRAVGQVSIWILVLTLLSPFVISAHRLSFVDPDCDPGLLTAAHQGARLHLPDESPGAGHCVICHWLRTMAGAAPGVGSSATLVRAVRQLDGSSIRPIRDDVPRTSRTSRAPPVHRPL